MESVRGWHKGALFLGILICSLGVAIKNPTCGKRCKFIACPISTELKRLAKLKAASNFCQTLKKCGVNQDKKCPKKLQRRQVTSCCLATFMQRPAKKIAGSMVKGGMVTKFQAVFPNWVEGWPPELFGNEGTWSLISRQQENNGFSGNSGYLYY